MALRWRRLRPRSKDLNENLKRVRDFARAKRVRFGGPNTLILSEKPED